MTIRESPLAQGEIAQVLRGHLHTRTPYAVTQLIADIEALSPALLDVWAVRHRREHGHLISGVTVTELDRDMVRRIIRIAKIKGAKRADGGMLVTGPSAEIRRLTRIIRPLLAQAEYDDQFLDALLKTVERHG